MPQNLTDLDLVTPSAVSDLGQPGGVLGGISNLQRELETTPELGGAFDSPERAAVSLMGLLTAGLMGGGRGAAGFGGGLLQGLSDQHAAEIEEYKGRLELANTVVEERQKTRALLSNLVAQSPGLFAETDETALNAAMFGGYGIEISPATMLATKRSNNKNKAKAEALLNGLKEAPEGTAKSFFASAYMNQVGLTLPKEAVDAFAQQEGTFTNEQIFDHFSNWPEILTAMEENGGIFPIDMAMERPAEGGTFSISEVSYGLLQRAGAYHQEQIKAGHENFTFQDAMNVSLTEPERTILRKEYSEFRPQLGDKEMARQYMQILAMMGFMGLANKDLMGPDFDANFKSMFNDMTTALGQLTDQETDEAEIRLINHYKTVVRDENEAAVASPALVEPMTNAEINAEAEKRAKKALVTGVSTKKEE